MADEALNLNEIAVGIANHVLDGMSSAAGAAFNRQANRIRLALRSGFASYLSFTHRKTNYVKTLLYMEESIPLSEIYISLNFTNSESTYDDQYIKSLVQTGGRVLVVGTAGSGKSMLIKRINVNLIEDYCGIFPIYFELRIFDSSGDHSLLQAIHANLAGHIPSMDYTDFVQALRRGKISLLLDGFDEIEHLERIQIGEQIDAISAEFPEVGILVTTRPEERLPGMLAFRVFQAEGMTKDQTLGLLDKLRYEEELKNSFIERVRDGLYEKHKEFLSNPLLTCMMLLTFAYHSEVPEKIHIFYQQAFETLFQRHDRSKGTYTRETYTRLPIDEFQRVFEHFCISTYLKQKFTFSEEMARLLLKESIEWTETGVAAEDFLSDLLESACLLQKDGIEFAFVHRSFQEYFTAKFISRLDGVAARKAIDAVSSRSTSDNVVAMLYDMEGELFERVWALPRLKSLIKKAERGGGYNGKNLVPRPFASIALAGRAFMVNDSSSNGVATMVLWLTYNILSREQLELSDQKESGEILDYIRASPKLSAEFAEAGGSVDLQFRPDGTPIEGEEFSKRSTSVMCEGLSQELLSALRAYDVAMREYLAWKRIKTEIELRQKQKKSQLVDLLGDKGR